MKDTNSLNRDGECKCDCHLPGQAHFGIDYHCSKCQINKDMLEEDFRKAFAEKIVLLIRKGDRWTPKQVNELLDKQLKFINTLLEEAKAEERRSCLEALPKKSYINYHLENNIEYIHSEWKDGRIWEKGFNSAIDQAISAISNKKNK